MSTKEINVQLPEDLITYLDVTTEVTHKNRTEILIEALREHLDDIESDESFQEAAIELYLADDIAFEPLVGIIGRQEAKEVQSKRLLDHDDKLADKLAER
jgi:metal-responsive CopG/Arc/MetJ family transcriptional regulator